MNNTASKFQMAQAEGFSLGMIERSNWDGEIMSKPTDADLEIVAEKVFSRFSLKFESGFDGRMSFIAGYWQGWKKAEQPRPEWQVRMEAAHAEMMEAV